MNRSFWLVVWTFLLLPFLVATTYRVEMQPESVVVYEASDQRDTWRGRAPLQSLDLTFDSEALATLTLQAVLDPGAFSSGNAIRDANARRGVFETGEYPTIVFRADGVAADTETDALSAGDILAVTLGGTLEMHGVTREVSVPAQVTLGNDTLRAEGTLSVLLSDYNMDRPGFLGNRVNDEVTVRFDVVGTLVQP